MKIIHIGLFIFLFNSCEFKENSNLKQINAKKENVLDSSTSDEISEAKHFYSLIQIKASKENIDSLIYPFDSLQIKIWISGGLYPSFRLYLINNANSIWSGTYYELMAEEKYATGEGTREYLSGPAPMEVKKSKKVTPKHGWTKFIDSLITLNILTLPDKSKIPEMKANWTDAITTFVEVSSKSQFRFYKYTQPDRFADKFWQADKMSRIESLFFTELLE